MSCTIPNMWHGLSCLAHSVGPKKHGPQAARFNGPSAIWSISEGSWGIMDFPTSQIWLHSAAHKSFYLLALLAGNQKNQKTHYTIYTFGGFSLIPITFWSCQQFLRWSTDLFYGFEDAMFHPALLNLQRLHHMPLDAKVWGGMVFGGFDRASAKAMVVLSDPFTTVTLSTSLLKFQKMT